MKSILFFVVLLLFCSSLWAVELASEHEVGPSALLELTSNEQQQAATTTEAQTALAAQIQHAVETETEHVIEEALDKHLCRNSNGDIFTCPKAKPQAVIKKVVVVKHTPPRFFYQGKPVTAPVSRKARASLNAEHADKLSNLLHAHRVEKFKNNHAIRRMERRHLLSQHIAQLKALHDRHERELARMKARQLEELQALDLQLSHEKHADKLHLHGHIHRSIKRPGVRRLRAERFD